MAGIEEQKPKEIFGSIDRGIDTPRHQEGGSEVQSGQVEFGQVGQVETELSQNPSESNDKFSLEGAKWIGRSPEGEKEFVVPSSQEETLHHKQLEVEKSEHAKALEHLLADGEVAADNAHDINESALNLSQE